MDMFQSKVAKVVDATWKIRVPYIAHRKHYAIAFVDEWSTGALQTILHIATDEFRQSNSVVFAEKTGCQRNSAIVPSVACMSKQIHRGTSVSP